MSFRGFLADLKKDGLLKEVHEPVSPRLEVTEYAWGKGPIFFDNVDGHKCCLNILGTRSLLARALGIESKDMVSSRRHWLRGSRSRGGLVALYGVRLESRSLKTAHSHLF